MADSRADYFKEYNKKSKVKSIRFPDEIINKIEEVCHTTNNSFNKVVIQLTNSALNQDNSGESCHTTSHTNVIQQHIQDKLFLMKFFQKHKEVLQQEITPEERNIFKEIVERLK